MDDDAPKWLATFAHFAAHWINDSFIYLIHQVLAHGPIILFLYFQGEIEIHFLSFFYLLSIKKKKKRKINQANIEAVMDDDGLVVNDN